MHWIKRLKNEKEKFTFQDPVLFKEEDLNLTKEVKYGEIDISKHIDIMNVDLTSTDYLNQLYQQDNDKTSQSKSSEWDSSSSKSKNESKVNPNDESEESEDSSEEHSNRWSIVTQESE